MPVPMIIWWNPLIFWTARSRTSLAQSYSDVAVQAVATTLAYADLGGQFACRCVVQRSGKRIDLTAKEFACWSISLSESGVFLQR